MPLISLDEFRKRYPEIVVSSHCFMIGGAIGHNFHEEVIIGDDVYRADVSQGLDPEGYRYGLNRVMSFDHYFCHSRSDEGKTPFQIMNAIYGDYKDAIIAFNENHPDYNRQIKYKSIY